MELDSRSADNMDMSDSHVSSFIRFVFRKPVRLEGSKMGSHRWLVLVFVLGLSSILAKSQQRLVLVGSGSSVPELLYARWAKEYGKQNPHIQMRYLPWGTTAGIEEVSHDSVDFGVGEVLLTAKQQADRTLILLPATLIAIVPIYNIPGLDHDLQLSGDVLAAIFLGDLKTWNAPQISRLNPGLTLPNIPIHVVYRAAGKGSNYVFTDFLSATSTNFHARIGTTASPHWPVGTVAERTSDMLDKVRNDSGSVGYVELQYAVRNNIPHAAVLNPAGRFVKASRESIAAAAQTLPQKSFSVSLVNAAAADSFSIASFSWIYVRINSTGSPRAAALADFLDWVYADGQQFAAEEGYVELPPSLLVAVRKKLKGF
jgi:phosphate transport system substrate-binding protein